MNKCLVFFVFVMNSCANQTQKNNGLIIDPGFHHDFFQDYPYGFVAVEDSLFVDSLLVSTDLTTREKMFSALIQDSSNKHYTFNTCRSYFLNDTLIIEFINKIINDGDKLRIKVLGSRLFVTFYSGEKKMNSEGLPIFLRLKESIKGGGQVLFGELKADFGGISESVDFIFEGPFTCVIEQ